MDKQMTTLRFNRALRHNVPPAADTVHQVEDQVLLFREKQVNTRIGEWLCPFILKGVDMDRKLVYVQLKEGKTPKAFGRAQVKKYLRPEILAHEFFVDLNHALQPFASDATGDEDVATFTTKVLEKGDPRANNQQMVAAK